uniref:Uncharacterized protein n=1 Tax=viral metagenome TaxID=1070528 RepID=A0A6C0EWE6_9ZZZZ
MTTGKSISLLGFTLVFTYIIIQILSFYGIGSDAYGVYLAFYAFLILSMFVLPTSNAHL